MKLYYISLMKILVLYIIDEIILYIIDEDLMNTSPLHRRTYQKNTFNETKQIF